jgi:hypothetical protein
MYTHVLEKYYDDADDDKKKKKMTRLQSLQQMKFHEKNRG